MLSVVLFSIFYNFNNYCGCCGYCCVDPKWEMVRQFEDFKIEDKEILNKGDEGYKAEDYNDISDISAVKLSLKDPAVTSKLNFNSIIKAKKYFKVLYNAYITTIKEEKAKEMFDEGYDSFVAQLVKDIGEKADFNFNQINEHLVFETSFSYKKSNYSKFKETTLTPTDGFKKIFNIIYASYKNKSDYNVYFEPILPNAATGCVLRKEGANKYKIVYNPNDPIDAQEIIKLESLDDNFFREMKFVFIVYLQSKSFFILLSDEQYKKMDEEYNKKKTP